VVERCVCSACYGPLIDRYHPDSRTSSVECANACGGPYGIVSKRTLEIRISQSQAELWEAKDALKEALPWIKKATGRSEADILSSLGF